MFSLAPSSIGGTRWWSCASPKACPCKITWCLESTRACPLYPWMAPWVPIINAESLSVMLLLTSLPCLPIFGALFFKNFSIRSACFCKLSICFCRFDLSEGLPPPCSSSSSFLSASSCSFSNRSTLLSIFCFFLWRSENLPLFLLEALEGSLHPSRANTVPPRRFSSSHTNSTSLNKGNISSLMDETKVDMVLWSGHCPQQSAIKVTFSLHAASIFLDDINPRA